MTRTLPRANAAEVVNILKRKPSKEDSRDGETVDEDEYKHIRNKHTRKALDALRQARRCQQYAYRLELRMKGKGKEIHDKLNKDALYKVVKEAKGDVPWEVELADKLVHDIDKPIKNILLQPLLKMCANKYHDRHNKRKEEAKKEEV